MFQSFALFKHMTVGENIAFGPRIQKQDVNLEARSDLQMHIPPLSCCTDYYCHRKIENVKHRLPIYIRSS